MDSIIAATFYAKCPSCGKLYEVIVDLVNKATDQNGKPDYKVICCTACKQHPVCLWLTPYNIRMIKNIQSLPSSEGNDNKS